MRGHRALRKTRGAAGIKDGGDLRARDGLDCKGRTIWQRLTRQKHKARARIREHVVHFRLAEARVYRHHHRTGEKRSPERDAPIQTVAKANCNTVAAFDSKIL